MNFKDRIMLLIKGSSDSSKVVEPKQKKVREKKITRLHLILAGLLVTSVLVVFIVIKVKISNKDVPYREYEKLLVNAADIYYDTKKIDIKDGATDKIKVQDLINEHYVNTDSKLVDKCDGYVESISQKDYNTGEYNVTRKAYIKCGTKYKTVNYISD